MPGTAPHRKCVRPSPVPVPAPVPVPVPVPVPAAIRHHRSPPPPPPPPHAASPNASTAAQQTVIRFLCVNILPRLSILKVKRWPRDEACNYVLQRQAYSDKHIGPSPPCRYQQTLFSVIMLWRRAFSHTKRPLPSSRTGTCHVDCSQPRSLTSPASLAPKGQAGVRNHTARHISSAEFH